ISLAPFTKISLNTRKWFNAVSDNFSIPKNKDYLWSREIANNNKSNASIVELDMEIIKIEVV
ncbi:24052_t:CDS:2, partial [Gigaspora margarita]